MAMMLHHNFCTQAEMHILSVTEGSGQVADKHICGIEQYIICSSSFKPTIIEQNIFWDTV